MILWLPFTLFVLAEGSKKGVKCNSGQWRKGKECKERNDRLPVFFERCFTRHPSNSSSHFTTQKGVKKGSCDKNNSFLIRIWLDSLWNIKTLHKKLLILQHSFLNNCGRKREFGRFQIRYEIFWETQLLSKVRARKKFKFFKMIEIRKFWQFDYFINLSPFKVTVKKMDERVAYKMSHRTVLIFKSTCRFMSRFTPSVALLSVAQFYNCKRRNSMHWRN